MPTYRPLSISVALRTTEMGPTVALTPPEKAVGEAEHKQREQLFLDGTPLGEAALPPPGESGVLNWIGSRDQFPFFMVHAGTELFRQPEKRPSAVEAALAKLRSQANTTGRQDRSALRSTGALTPGIRLSSPAKLTFDPDELSSLISSSPLSSAKSSVTPDVIGDEAPENSRKSAIPPAAGGDIDSSPNPHSRLRSHLTRETDVAKSFTGTSTHQNQIAVQFLNQLPEEPKLLLTPQALAVVVVIPKEAFRTFDGQTNRLKRRDLKIEVFINGELAESAIHAAVRLKEKVDEPLKFIFHGRRIDRHACRPWSVIPWMQTAKGELVGTSGKHRSPQDRWQEISLALLQEAYLRGWDRDGNRAPTGEYLEALSRVGMPERLEEMHKHSPGKHSKLGVVDVVVTLGEGRKDIHTFSYGVERFEPKNSRFSSLNAPQVTVRK
jgi:hypothetical protein